MKGRLTAIYLLLLFVSFSFAQDDYQHNEAHRKLRSLEERQSSLPKTRRLKLQLSTTDAQKIQPSEIDLQNYAHFLKNKNTGIAKVFQDRKCNQQVIKTNDFRCIDAIQIYGNGSYFTFTERTYFRYYFTELYFADGVFKVYPLMDTSFGMIMDLGDVGLESIDKTSIQIKELVHFKAPKKITEVNPQRFQRQTLVKRNNTFAARFIHYPNPYSEKVRDGLYVFRVVGFNSDESVTIVWKKIKV